MLILGVCVIIVGFAYLIPRGTAPGSVAHRVVPMAKHHLKVTPGYQDGPFPTWRRAVLRVIASLAAIALGLWMISIGWPEGR